MLALFPPHAPIQRPCDHHSWGFFAAEAGGRAQAEAVRSLFFFAHFAEGALGRPEAVATFRADEYSCRPALGAKGLVLSVRAAGGARPGCSRQSNGVAQYVLAAATETERSLWLERLAAEAAEASSDVSDDGLSLTLDVPDEEVREAEETRSGGEARTAEIVFDMLAEQFCVRTDDGRSDRFRWLIDADGGERDDDGWHPLEFPSPSDPRSGWTGGFNPTRASILWMPASDQRAVSGASFIGMDVKLKSWRDMLRQALVDRSSGPIYLRMVADPDELAQELALVAESVKNQLSPSEVVAGLKSLSLEKYAEQFLEAGIDSPAAMTEDSWTWSLELVMGHSIPAVDVRKISTMCHQIMIQRRPLLCVVCDKGRLPELEKAQLDIDRYFAYTLHRHGDVSEGGDAYAFTKLRLKVCHRLQEMATASLDLTRYQWKPPWAGQPERLRVVTERCQRVMEVVHTPCRLLSPEAAIAASSTHVLHTVTTFWEVIEDAVFTRGPKPNPDDVVGTAKIGDILLALEERDGRVQTHKGWISKVSRSGLALLRDTSCRLDALRKSNVYGKILRKLAAIESRQSSKGKKGNTKEKSRVEGSAVEATIVLAQECLTNFDYERACLFFTKAIGILVANDANSTQSSSAQALAKEPSQLSMCLACRGEVYMLLGQYAMAIEDAEQSETVQGNAVDVLPKDSSLRCWLAKSYYVRAVCTLVLQQSGATLATLAKPHRTAPPPGLARSVTPDIEPLQHGVDLMRTARKLQPHNATYKTFHRKLRIRASITETLAETDCMPADESEATARAFLLTCLDRRKAACVDPTHRRALLQTFRSEAQFDRWVTQETLAVDALRSHVVFCDDKARFDGTVALRLAAVFGASLEPGSRVEITFASCPARVGRGAPDLKSDQFEIRHGTSVRTQGRLPHRLPAGRETQPGPDLARFLCISDVAATRKKYVENSGLPVKCGEVAYGDVVTAVETSDGESIRTSKGWIRLKSGGKAHLVPLDDEAHPGTKWYRVLQQAAVTKQFDLDPKTVQIVAVLEAGGLVMAVDSKVTDDWKQRIKMTKGWVSVYASGGDTLLEPVLDAWDGSLQESQCLVPRLGPGWTAPQTLRLDLRYSNTAVTTLIVSTLDASRPAFEAEAIVVPWCNCEGVFSLEAATCRVVDPAALSQETPVNFSNDVAVIDWVVAGSDSVLSSTLAELQKLGYIGCVLEVDDRPWPCAYKDASQPVTLAANIPCLIVRRSAGILQQVITSTGTVVHASYNKTAVENFNVVRLPVASCSTHIAVQMFKRDSFSGVPVLLGSASLVASTMWESWEAHSLELQNYVDPQMDARVCLDVKLEHEDSSGAGETSVTGVEALTESAELPDEFCTQADKDLGTLMLLLAERQRLLQGGCVQWQGFAPEFDVVIKAFAVFHGAREAHRLLRCLQLLCTNQRATNAVQIQKVVGQLLQLSKQNRFPATKLDVALFNQCADNSRLIVTSALVAEVSKVESSQSFCSSLLATLSELLLEPEFWCFEKDEASTSTDDFTAALSRRDAALIEVAKEIAATSASDVVEKVMRPDSSLTPEASIEPMLFCIKLGGATPVLHTLDSDGHMICLDLMYTHFRAEVRRLLLEQLMLKPGEIRLTAHPRGDALELLTLLSQNCQQEALFGTLIDWIDSTYAASLFSAFAGQPIDVDLLDSLVLAGEDAMAEIGEVAVGFGRIVVLHSVQPR
jgi:hypothetical protein